VKARGGGKSMVLKIFRRLSAFNRRQYVRLNINCLAKFNIETEGKKVNCLTNVVNLSEGGLLLITFDRQIPAGTKVELQFQLPLLDKTISATGEVRRSYQRKRNLFQAGVKLSDLKIEDKKMIREFVSRHLKPKKR
jgi:hypothetical protein